MATPPMQSVTPATFINPGLVFILTFSIPKRTARKKVIAGSVFDVAAPNDADVYFKPTPTISKLKVIPNRLSKKILMKSENDKGGAVFRSREMAMGSKKRVAVACL